MDKQTGIIMIVVAIVILIGLNFLVFSNEDKIENSKSNAKVGTITKSEVQTQNTEVSEEETTLTNTLVGEHDSNDDCWLIIDNKVYDLTNYISRHPGGKSEIANLCGKDGSVAFNNEHGQKELDKVSQYVVGNIGDELN